MRPGGPGAEPSATAPRANRLSHRPAPDRAYGHVKNPDGTWSPRFVRDADTLTRTRLPEIVAQARTPQGTPQFYGLGRNVSYDDSRGSASANTGENAVGRTGVTSADGTVRVEYLDGNHLGALTRE